MSERLLSREETAALLRVPPKTLAAWAYAGRGPTYFRAGRRCLYRESEVIDWLEERRVTPEGRGGASFGLNNPK